MSIAVIPARGGSKGIPRKNLCLVGGLPLVAHSVIQALGTPHVEQVVVSTEDDEIASVARKYGALIVERPACLAQDDSSTESVLEHAMRSLGVATGGPEWIVLLQPTSPLRRPHDIGGAIQTLRSEGADSVFSACVSHGFVWRLGASEPRALNYTPAERPRRQQGPRDVVENGSIYVFKPWVLHTLGCRLGGKIAVHMMRQIDSFQIDEPEDLELVEYLFSAAYPIRPTLPQVHK